MENHTRPGARPCLKGRLVNFHLDYVILSISLQGGINLLMATPWFSSYAANLRDFIGFVHREYNQIRYLFPINSHDSGSPAQEYGSAQATVPRYTVSLLLGTGYAGTTQGVEYGLEKKIKFIGRQKKLELSAHTWGLDFSDFFSTVHAIVETNPLFQCGGNIQFIDHGHPAALGAWRFDPKQPQNGFLVIANLDTNNEQTLKVNIEANVPLLKGRTLIEQFSGDEVVVDVSEIEFKLPPCGILIYAAASVE